MILHVNPISYRSTAQETTPSQISAAAGSASMDSHPDYRRHPNHLLLSLPHRHPLSFSGTYAAAPPSPFPFSPSLSASTPSKLRRHPLMSSSAPSIPSLLLLFLSLLSLYSIPPFLRSTPSPLALLPFSFLVSLFSFLLLLPFSRPKSLTLTLAPSLTRPLAAKSTLLSLVLFLRFLSLRYCSAGASILADLSGSLVAKSVSDESRRSRRGRRFLGFAALGIALVLLSKGWDRIGCFPLSSSSFPPPEGCGGMMPMLLPFLSGFLGFYERSAGNSGPLRQLGRRRVRLASLACATLILLFPASICFFFEAAGGGVSSVSVSGMVWPLISTVVLGVVLYERYGSSDEKIVFSAKDCHREFLATFICTLILELIYFPKLSLPGFLLCGFLLWVSVWELSSSSLSFVELGSLHPSENLYSMVMNPIQHIMSERKTQKIALFLLINTGYMVVEFVAGFMSNSLGLISDACHMLFDCAALAIGLYASYISRLPANNQFNYGRSRFEVLSGYANAVFLVLVGALIVLESMERILDPQEISTSSLLAVSVGGLVVNIIGLVFFHEEHHHAHGGGSSCSHSHSSCSNSHSQSNSDAQSHSISYHLSHEHLHGAHDHDSCNHGFSHSFSHHDFDHHQDHHDENGYDDHHTHGEKHDRHSTHQEHDKHSDHHEHDHQDQMHHVQAHNHENSSKHDHKHNPHQRNHEHHHCQHNHEHYHRQHNHEHQNLLTGIREEGLKMHYHIDHNMEGIFLHVLADTMGSIGVVISTLLIKYKGWLIADPACSIFISIMIISSVIPLLRNSAEILLQRIPRTHEQNLRVALDSLMRIGGVSSIPNMHVWNLSNTEIVGTVHLLVSPEADKVLIKKSASNLFHEAGVKDITIQVECLT